jgi:N-glycosidase YbiA
MYPPSDEGLNRETDSAVYYFTPAYYPLDSFSAHTVHIWGKTFPTAEHAFQWKKFSVVRPAIAEQVLRAKSPHAVKEISDAHKTDAPTNWNEVKVTFMEEIYRAKYEQHIDVQEVLKKTGNKQIIDNSPVDNFWGTGPHGNGENMLGKIWMKIRDGQAVVRAS